MAAPTRPTVPRGERLIRIGVGITLLGMVCTMVALLPLFTGATLPPYMWALAMTTGVGFALVIAGLLVNGRARARFQRSPDQAHPIAG